MSFSGAMVSVVESIPRAIEFIAVLGAAVAVIHRWIILPITGALHRQAEESRQLRSVLDDVVDIRRELKRNGGTSLRDAVIRIEDGMNDLKGRFDAHIDLHLQDGRTGDSDG
jgi:hypothetical protein